MSPSSISFLLCVQFEDLSSGSFPPLDGGTFQKVHGPDGFHCLLVSLLHSFPGRCLRAYCGMLDTNVATQHLLSANEHLSTSDLRLLVVTAHSAFPKAVSLISSCE